jgi:phosphatidylglycerophosphate synthase
VAQGVHPDVISYLSMVASAAAAICFWQAARWPVLLLLGPLLCYVRLWFNMLDGMVALASGKASRHGEILNEVPDRVSDVVVFVGVAHSGLCAPILGYWAAIAALMTAYIGILGQAVGAGREFSGIMSKPWRMVVLHVGAWGAWIGLQGFGRGGDPARPSALTVLDWTCLAIVVGCAETIFVRLARILRRVA